VNVVKLVCFAGVDGSGKTSHSKELTCFLQNKGYPAKYVRAASRPILIYPFTFFTRIMGYWTTVQKGAWTDPLEKASPKVRARLGRIYLAFLFIDYLITSFIKVRTIIYSKRIVVCDRYLFDLLMEIELAGFNSELFRKLIIYTAVKPDLIFYVNSTLQIILERRPEFTKQNILSKQRVYEKFIKIYNFKEISTLRDFDENQTYIRSEVLKKI
jgi:thymidylate kinase